MKPFENLLRRLPGLLEQNRREVKEILVLLAVRFLYVFLTVTMLDGVWYAGREGYDIAFHFGKELLGVLLFLPMAALYVKLPFGGVFAKTAANLLFVLSCIPVNSAYSINNQPFAFLLASQLYFALLLVAISFLSRKINLPLRREPGIKGTQMRSKAFVWVCVIVCVLTVIYKLCYNGFSFSLSIEHDDVYTTRDQYQQYLESIEGTLFAYLLTILRNLIIVAAPMYILSALLRKKYIGVLIGVACVLADYSMSSGKGFLLYVVVAVAVYIFKRFKLISKFGQIFNRAMILVLLASWVECMIRGTSSIYMLLVRRVMYLPAWLTTMYFDFFSANPPVLWTQNTFLLQNILPSVYESAPLTIISQQYFAGAVPSPNTGLFAEAMMHFGYFGIVIYPVLIACLISFASAAYKRFGAAGELLMAALLVMRMIDVPIVRTDFVLSVTAFAGICAIIAYRKELAAFFGPLLDKYLPRRRERE